MKAAIVTATRAEYGILRPLIIKMHNDPGIDLQLLVTGTHLCSEYGNTQVEIESDGLPIFRRIPILYNGNSSFAVSKTMSNALVGFAEYFEDESPDCIIVLGDRTEMLGVCAAAICSGIPIVHLHGGELTEGAVDDCVRHAITKMSYLHFPSTEIYRRRIIQMGENPDRVFNVGALGVENILSVPLMTEKEIRESLGIPNDKKIVSVTFHPVTLEAGSEEEQTRELIEAMAYKPEYYYVITMANADAGGEKVNRLLGEFCENVQNAIMISSLGMKKYLSVIKYSRFVLGNSSSGIIEAPSLGTPTVNIGNRQSGRLMADTVISCAPKKETIIEAMEQAEHMPHTPSFIYGDSNTSGKIIKVIKEVFSKKVIPVKKFYDIDFEV
nr:UDP-N-acetylglucosamine 2-epimerase [uncultured Flavobacterium sp.]